MSTTKAENSVYHIVLLAFDGSSRAQSVLKELEDGQKLAGYKILIRAVVERDLTGKVTIHEPGRGGVGTALGATAGGLLGLFGGPLAVVVLALAGGTAGGIAGHFAGRAIPAEDLRRMGDALPNNSSGLVLLAEDTEAEKVIDDLKGYQANVVTVTVGSELFGEIAAAVAADVTLLDDGTAPAIDASAPTEALPAAESTPSAATESAASAPTTPASEPDKGTPG